MPRMKAEWMRIYTLYLKDIERMNNSYPPPQILKLVKVDTF